MIDFRREESVQTDNIAVTGRGVMWSMSFGSHERASTTVLSSPLI